MTAHPAGDSAEVERVARARNVYLLQCDNAVLSEALRQCRDQFAFYGREHRAAGKNDKAQTNERFAKIAADALAVKKHPALTSGSSAGEVQRLRLIARALRTRMATACDWTRAGKDHVKVRTADWHVLMEIAESARTALRSVDGEAGRG
jgi:hypothetical protein